MNNFYYVAKSITRTITLLSAFICLQPVNAQTYLTVPYATGFETGPLGAEWITTSSLSTGQIFISPAITSSWGTAGPHSGTYFLGMHHTAAGGGSYNQNEAKLHLDLSGETDINLDFWWSDFNDELEPQDGVYISDDGGSTFVKILDLYGPSYTDLTWYFFSIDLDSAATVHNLNFNSTFVVKFQQYDNYYFAGGNDGHLLDDIFVYPACFSFETTSVMQCSTYTVPSGDETYTTSGIYSDTLVNAAGCDSIITINLTIGNSYWTGSHSACNSFTVPSGDETYTMSGIVTDTIPNAAGCDSIFTIDLTINYTSYNTITEASCGDYMSPGGNVYTTSGTYNDTLLSSTVCDSIITIQLSVTHIDTTVSQSGITLTSGSASGTYQWIDCATSQPVPGATGQTYIPAADGDYAVIVTLNSCTDTSGCYTVNGVGVDEFSTPQFNIYPNPGSGVFMIEMPHSSNTEIKVYDVTGARVYETSIQQSGRIDLSHLAKGIYQVEVNTLTGKTSRKIVIH